ncbi:unnamed protein product [Didymodactylos carnosus]|uniref:Small integral membrane protein 14 n=1 Tax=Didymodactylos carnosus TaxID=1234261 RepID=A0A813WMA7_9BILA|nr:unnamed protein product [Didymodactylos carnosus]CAF3645165.1 unnamed protein product [Didymodactylos carnosus]
MDGAGGSGGFDPCECIISHEGAMQRLISMLRNAQTTCTDSECFTGSLPGTTPTPERNTTMWMMFIAWVGIAFLLFIFRPRSLQSNRDLDKSSNQGPRRQDPPGPEVQ